MKVKNETTLKHTNNAGLVRYLCMRLIHTYVFISLFNTRQNTYIFQTYERDVVFVLFIRMR
jgi:hypothetical protein